MAYETLGFEIRERVARITLNRPERFNAMNLEMTRELMALAIECGENPDVRAVLVSGTGKAFCAGGDLPSFREQGEALGRHVKEMTTYLHAAISRFAWMQAPLVGAVNGVAAGAGFSLALACDLVVAAQSARFTMAYTRAGLSPDGSSTYYLPRLVGLRRAMELSLTNRQLSAEEALAWGIANRVVPDANCLEEAEALALELAAGATRAYGAVKKLMAMSLNDSLEGQLERESRCIAEMTRTADAREGIQAFCEKRPPSFAGR